MSTFVSRRGFIGGLGAVAASTALSSRALVSLLATNADSGSRLFPVADGALPELLYPPMDLSYFDTQINSAPVEFHLGYASITWIGDDRHAIEYIAALGFPGIQLRSNAIRE